MSLAILLTFITFQRACSKLIIKTPEQLSDVIMVPLSFNTEQILILPLVWIVPEGVILLDRVISDRKLTIIETKCSLYSTGND